MADNRDDVLSALAEVGGALDHSRDPWWVIGSAAVYLHGGEPGNVADIDVIVSRRDLDVLYERLPLSDTPEPGKPMFVSERFGRWSEPALDIEFMTGLKLRTLHRWESVQPLTREPIECGGHRVFVPQKAELIEILHRFGREKDLQRAATLCE